MFKPLILLASLVLSSQWVMARELIIISDLDDTLRMANIEKKVKAGAKLLAGVKPYEGLRAIFQDIKANNSETKFYYLSNSYPFLYNGDKWTNKNELPEGVIFQRCLKDKSDEFKPRKLKEIFSRHPDANFLLFGDNVEHDPKFYQDFLEETNAQARIYIRDARLIFPVDPLITFYQTEAQLTDELRVSPETSSLIEQLPYNKLVPRFLLKNLKKRLIKSCKDTKKACKKMAERRVLEVIDLTRPTPLLISQDL